MQMSLLGLGEDLLPRKQMRADRRSEKEILLLIQRITVEYGLPDQSLIMLARRLNTT